MIVVVLVYRDRPLLDPGARWCEDAPGSTRRARGRRPRLRGSPGLRRAGRRPTGSCTGGSIRRGPSRGAP